MTLTQALRYVMHGSFEPMPPVFNIGYASYGQRKDGTAVFHVLKVGRLTFTFSVARRYKPLAPSSAGYHEPITY